MCQQLSIYTDLAVYKQGDLISEAGFNPPFILLSLTNPGVTIGLKKAVNCGALVADFNVEFCRIKTE